MPDRAPCAFVRCVPLYFLLCLYVHCVCVCLSVACVCLSAYFVCKFVLVCKFVCVCVCLIVCLSYIGLCVCLSMFLFVGEVRGWSELGCMHHQFVYIWKCGLQTDKHTNATKTRSGRQIRVSDDIMWNQKWYYNMNQM